MLKLFQIEKSDPSAEKIAITGNEILVSVICSLTRPHMSANYSEQTSRYYCSTSENFVHKIV